MNLILKSAFLNFLMVFVFFNVSAAEPSHNFTLYTLEDNLFSSDDVMAKPDAKLLVVDFFSIYCEPCKKALPEWEKVYLKYKGKGLKFVVVALPVEEDRAAEFKKIQSFFKTNKYSFPVVFDKYSLTGKKFGIVDTNGSASIPQIFMIDKSGKLTFKNANHLEIIKKIEEVLGK